MDDLFKSLDIDKSEWLEDIKGRGHAKNFFIYFSIKLNWICITCCKKIFRTSFSW